MLSGHFNVLIIGAGVVGASIARELSRYEVNVLLLEKEIDVSFGTSKANSGIVHSGIHDSPGTLKASLCVRGNQLYQTLASELNLLYKNNGTLIVGHSMADLSQLEQLQQQGKQNGVPGISWLNAEQIHHLEPNLNQNLTAGLLAASGGIVSPFDFTYALTENAVANGVKLLLNAEVTKIDVVNNGLIVETTLGLFETDYLINAAGLYSANLSRLIGDDSFDIQPVKGEEYLLDRRLEGLVNRTIFPLPTPTSKGILVIPTVDGNIMIGPTAHPVADCQEVATSLTGWQEIYQAARTLLVKLNPTDLIASFAGLRATTCQEDFIIRPSTIISHFIHVAGINSPGLTAAPAIAEYTVDILRENGLHLKAQPNFKPQRPLVRFRNLNREQQSELIENDPSYANIVCRCELISEAEVRAAIRRGATTMDGIKLRTRCGMGRCQGGFCTSKLIQILSEELGLAPEAVTKKGPGSFLLNNRLRPKYEVKKDA